jgi:hypothetical protein
MDRHIVESEKTRVHFSARCPKSWPRTDIGRQDPQDTGAGMFFFFSNKMGCAGSLLISAVLTLLVLLLMGVL